MSTDELQRLTDWELADYTKAAEIAFQNAIAEVDRRRIERSYPDWSEEVANIMLGRKRDDSSFYPKPSEGYPTNLPPALFRIGYEWAVLTIIALLEKILSKPSSDLIEAYEFKPAGKGGLYKLADKPRPQDPRRRAALDLIGEIERFAETSMFLVLPPRRSTYQPTDDAVLETGAPSTPEPLVKW